MHERTSIRPATKGDESAVVELAVSNRMFALDEVDGLTGTYRAAVSPRWHGGGNAFYRARGFDEEARIREFYGPGHDKVVYWKALTR